jgi:predicted ester cyclase
MPEKVGPYGGGKGGGISVSVTEMEIARCENGRIVELRQVIDLPGLMAQLSP